MGYYTRFALSWTPTPAWRAKPLCEHPRQPDKSFCADCGRPAIDVPLDDVIGDYIEAHKEMSYAMARDGTTNNGDSKWYDHQEDLAAMSRAIPNVLLHLEGIGDTFDDVWDAFALDGHVEKHQAKIVRATEPTRAFFRSLQE